MNTYVQCIVESSTKVPSVLHRSCISKKNKPILKFKKNNITTNIVECNDNDNNELIECNDNSKTTKLIECKNDKKKNILNKTSIQPIHHNPYYEDWFSEEELDYVGFIITYYNKRTSPQGIDQLFTFIREHQYYFTYPIIFDDNDDPNKFRYKKYIIKKCREYFNIDKKNILTITYVNDENNIRNYIIRLKKLYPINKTNLNTINCIDIMKYIWRQYIIDNSNWMNSYYLISDFPDNYNTITVKKIYDIVNHI